MGKKIKPITYAAYKRPISDRIFFDDSITPGTQETVQGKWVIQSETQHPLGYGPWPWSHGWR